MNSVNVPLARIDRTLLSPQFASTVLGEHPEEAEIHLRRARDRGGGSFAARHLADLYGRLHQDGAQAQQGWFTQMNASSDRCEVRTTV